MEKRIIIKAVGNWIIVKYGERIAIECANAYSSHVDYPIRYDRKKSEPVKIAYDRPESLPGYLKTWILKHHEEIFGEESFLVVYCYT